MKMKLQILIVVVLAVVLLAEGRGGRGGGSRRQKQTPKDRLARVRRLVDKFARVCKIDKTEGDDTCDDPKPSQRFFFNPESGECEAFQFKGCGKRQNFMSESNCKRICIEIPAKFDECEQAQKGTHETLTDTDPDNDIDPKATCKDLKDAFQKHLQKIRAQRAAAILQRARDKIGKKCSNAKNEGTGDCKKPRPATRFFFNGVGCESFQYQGCDENRKNRNFPDEDHCKRLCIEIPEKLEKCHVAIETLVKEDENDVDPKVPCKEFKEAMKAHAQKIRETMRQRRKDMKKRRNGK